MLSTYIQDYKLSLPSNLVTTSPNIPSLIYDVIISKEGDDCMVWMVSLSWSLAILNWLVSLNKLIGEINLEQSYSPFHLIFWRLMHKKLPTNGIFTEKEVHMTLVCNLCTKNELFIHKLFFLTFLGSFPLLDPGLLEVSHQWEIDPLGLWGESPLTYFFRWPS